MDSLQKISNDLVESINEKEKKKSIPYDTYAKVIRIDGGTAWVHIPGGVDETPVALTVNAKVGDSVLVRVSGGNAWIVGNSSAPPTDDTKAVEAKDAADGAQIKAESAQETAEGAEEIAKDASRAVKSTSQYFWHTETDTGAGAGAHITEVPQEDFLNDPANGGGNLLAQSGGIAIRDGLTDLATFGANGAQIGKTVGAHSAIDTNGQRFYGSNGNTLLANIGYGPGTSQSGTATAPYYDFGIRESNTTIGNYSVAAGLNVTASGYSSHAEGDSCVAMGHQSHAEGSMTGASGRASHSEGWETGADGDYSHSQNEGTVASKKGQTALGTYNIADMGSSRQDYGDYAVIIGNGAADNSRSNALTVDWQGNIDMAGSLQSFFSIVDLKVSAGQVAAHAQNNIGTVTVPSADRPDGMTLVGIVGVACNNYRVVPYNYYVNGAHSITCAVVNTTTAQSAAGTTMTFKLLYAKMASA